MKDPDIAYGLMNADHIRVDLYDQDDIYLGTQTMGYCVMWNVPVQKEDRGDK